MTVRISLHCRKVQRSAPRSLSTALHCCKRAVRLVTSTNLTLEPSGWAQLRRNTWRHTSTLHMLVSALDAYSVFVQFPNIIRSILLSSVNWWTSSSDTLGCIMDIDHHSAVGIETTLRSRPSGVRILAEGENFFLLQNVRTGSGIHSAFHLTGTGFLSPRLKRPGRDVDHSNPSSADVKNEWSYTSPPLYAFMVWRGAILPAPFLVLDTRSFF